MKNKKLFILLLIVPIIIFFIGRSFSKEVEKKNIYLNSPDYDNPGSYNIVRFADWSEYNKVRVRTTLNSILKTEDDRKKDIIIVLDISGSMSGRKEFVAIENIYEMATYFLSNSINRMALITFDTTSTIRTAFTNNKDTFLNILYNLSMGGETNYNDALKNVDVVMENYEPREDTDLIT